MPITEDGTMTIAPKDIPITHHFFDAFGQYETESSARWIVEYCRIRDKGWTPFSYEELNKFYQSHFPNSRIRLNGLDGDSGKGSKYPIVVSGENPNWDTDTRVFRSPRLSSAAAIRPQLVRSRLDI
jgi:hypothetical protein